ncbi:MAG: hypothetical protein HWN81_05855 [Candidatus Lokiarchaeota archaeon]|nr:hypothetical protein [Candidatus Lokiarchaeota archaeon]
MSHILEEYSKNLEVKPSKVFINKHFYPIIPDNYIVIYNEQDIDVKCYNYYALVIDLIKGQLEKNNIEVVVIGSNENITDRCDYSYPSLSFRKNAYIISKSKALISVDNALTQYASSQGIPVVTLYGNIYPSATTPYWGNKKNKIDIEPKWNKKPSMSLSDPDNPIDKIAAEKVAESCLKMLSLNNNHLKNKITPKVNFKTKVINKNKSTCIDVVPTDYKNLELFEDKTLNIRLDLGKADAKAFDDYCSNHKCSIVLKNSFIQLDTIKKNAENIESICVIATEKPENVPKQYFSALKSMGIEFHFLVQNKEILDDIRFDYFDQLVEYEDKNDKKPDFISLNSYFFSFKLVVESDKVYKSTYHWKNNIDNSDKVVDNVDYWEEIDYFYIYEQDRNSQKIHHQENN